MITAASPPLNGATPAVTPALRPPESAAAGALPAEAALRAPTRAPVAPRVQFDPDKVMRNLREAIDEMNSRLAGSGRHLGFALDDVLNSPIVTVRNTETGEVIRQIPSEAVVRVAHTLDQLKGLLLDATT